MNSRFNMIYPYYLNEGSAPGILTVRPTAR